MLGVEIEFVDDQSAGSATLAPRRPITTVDCECLASDILASA
jgi:hypothetical protein